MVSFRSAEPSAAVDAGEDSVPAASSPSTEGNGVAEPSAEAPSSDAAASGPPSLVRDLASIIVAKGSPATFECQISGNPAEVVWMRNGKELKSSGDVEIEAAGSTFRLTLKNPSADDSGTYQCETRQAGQTVSTVCTLLVNGKSFFILLSLHKVSIGIICFRSRQAD